MSKNEMKEMLDINDTENQIEVKIAPHPNHGFMTLWVNIDGVCRLRVFCRRELLRIEGADHGR